VRNDAALGVAYGGGALYVVGYVGVANNNSAPGGCGEQDWGCQAFIRKYDSGGNLVWSRQFGTCCFTAATGVAVNNQGVFVVGSGPVFLYRFDFDGNLVWTSQEASYEYNYGYIIPRHPAIAASNDSLYLIGSGQLWKYDLNGGLVWNRRISIQGLFVEVQGVAVSSGGAYVAGDAANASRVGMYSSFIMKYDPEGNELWHRTFSGESYSSMGLAVSASSSNVYVAGVGYGFYSSARANQESMGYVASYDSNGTETWIRYIGASPAPGGYLVTTRSTALSSDSLGIYFAAVTTGVLNTTSRAGGTLVGRFDLNGNKIWTRQLTSTFDPVNGIALDSDGAYYVGGVWGNSVSDRLSIGGSDAFVIREPKAADIPLKIYSRCSNGRQGDNVTCSVSIYGGNPPYTISWDFGDGTKASGDTISHIYRNSGQYSVTVKVRDASGLIDVSSTRKDVSFQLIAPANIPFILAGVITVLAAGSFVIYRRRSRRRMKAERQIPTEALSSPTSQP